MNSFKLTDAVIEWVDGSIRICYNKETIARLEYDSTAQIRWIWVNHEFRRKGIAKMMLAEVERRTGLVATPLPPVSELAKGLFQ